MIIAEEHDDWINLCKLAAMDEKGPFLTRADWDPFDSNGSSTLFGWRHFSPSHHKISRYHPFFPCDFNGWYWYQPLLCLSEIRADIRPFHFGDSNIWGPQRRWSFPLGGANIILGIFWLETLGNIKVTWHKLTTSFMHKGQKVHLCGNPPNSFSCYFLVGVFFNGFTSHSWHSWFNYCSVRTASAPPTKIFWCFLASHLQFYVASHWIMSYHCNQALAPSLSVLINSYEIELLISEMPAAEIICPSASLLSSPILLESKKDGRWHICIDYHELNKATILDNTISQSFRNYWMSCMVLLNFKKFSKLIFRPVHQIQVAVDDVPKTAFQTHSRHYEFIIMPFRAKRTWMTYLKGSRKVEAKE